LHITNTDIAAFAAGFLALLLWAVLHRLTWLGRELAEMRRHAEQSVAGARSDAEQIYNSLLSSERALAARVAETRVAMEQRFGDFAARMVREQGEARVHIGEKMNAMADAQARHMAELHRGLHETLHQAVEQQMTASFARVLEQFTAVQQAVGDVQAVAAQIGDMKRIFAGVKTRGVWGEAQLRAVLDDLLPDSYLANVRLRDESADVVEFCVRMPGRGGDEKLLPIDAKFPLADYEKMLAAADVADAEAERGARRALEARLRLEARKIAAKYLLPPLTTDFAVMYLPTDGLYAEAARIPGLIDDLGRLHVLVMGPSLLPALLRTVRLGYVTLALEEKAGQIGRLLGAVKQEMLRMDDVLEKLARGAGTLGKTIEDARRRTRVVSRKLRDVELMGPADAEAVLALEEEVELPG
jgi:DNA recombination protein RmuC